MAVFSGTVVGCKYWSCLLMFNSPNPSAYDNLVQFHSCLKEESTDEFTFFLQILVGKCREAEGQGSYYLPTSAGW